MKRAFVGALVAILPVAGAVILAGAWSTTRSLPDRGELARLEELASAYSKTRQALMAAEPASPDALVDRLPRTLTVGALLQRLETAARQAGVRAVSFATEDTEPESTVQVSDVGVDFDPREGTVGPRPERLRCLFNLEADYRALVQFLGLVESMPEATRVRSLSVRAIDAGVSAIVGLEGYAYAGDGGEVRTPARPAMEAR